MRSGSPESQENEDTRIARLNRAANRDLPPGTRVAYSNRANGRTFRFHLKPPVVDEKEESSPDESDTALIDASGRIGLNDLE